MTDRTDREDIGSGHSITLYTDADDDTITGLIAWHQRPDGTECNGGSVLFDVPANAHAPAHTKWTVITLDPLHLEPSLLCTRCGDHGFIRLGRWVPA